MSHSLNSLEGIIQGIIQGTTIGVTRGDTNYGSDGDPRKKPSPQIPNSTYHASNHGLLKPKKTWWRNDLGAPKTGKLNPMESTGLFALNLKFPKRLHPLSSVTPRP